MGWGYIICHNGACSYWPLPLSLCQLEAVGIDPSLVGLRVEGRGKRGGGEESLSATMRSVAAQLLERLPGIN